MSSTSPVGVESTPTSPVAREGESGASQNPSVEQPSIQTTTNEAPNSSNPSASKKAVKKSLKRSEAWDHYTAKEDKNGKMRAYCNYCEKSYAAESGKNGTSGMNTHMKKCKNHPNYKKNTRSINTLQGFVQGEDGQQRRDVVPRMWKFDQVAIRKALIHMIIVDELPFRFVENEGFKDFMKTTCPEFFVPSRTTVARDCLKIYGEAKSKLKAFFKKSGQRVSLTTDTWTSVQRVNYMCLTAHYIDDDWKLIKKIINFIPCPSHKGDELSVMIEKCLGDWGIKKVFVITVDNASANDSCLNFLKRRFENKGMAIAGGKYMHMRCVAHILNLIVKDGLKDVNTSVERVRTVVKYVRQSPGRLKKFKEFVDEEKIDSEKALCLDVPTRWNSVFAMLEVAVIYKNAFERYEVCDADFRADFLLDVLPTKKDWDIATKMVEVLRHFNDFTDKVSGTQYTTSNLFVDHVCDIYMLLKSWIAGNDGDLRVMALKMKDKFDKYWDEHERLNLLLYVPVLLDPRRKYNYVLYVLKKMYGDVSGSNLAKKVKDALFNLFDEYKSNHEVTSLQTIGSGTSRREVSSSTPIVSTSPASRPVAILSLVNARERGWEMEFDGACDETELERFLGERLIKVDPKTFDILEWWKCHSKIYPVLATLARDLLAMPLSTVASESAFSTGGRVISDFRSSLTPKTVQALICYQDWHRRGPLKSIEENVASLERIENDLATEFNGLNIDADLG